MREQYRLVGLRDSELLAGLSELVRRSNELTGSVLAHLAELEERRLHLELGFSSALAYCVQALGLSEGAAGRRLIAARVCKRFPEAFALVARGDLHLSALCALGPYLDAENASELCCACAGKTRRQVEELLTVRFPKPDVKEQIRRLPVRAGIAPAVSAPPTSERGEVFGRPALTDAPLEATNTQTRGIPVVPEPRAAEPTGGSRAPRRREIEQLAVARFGVHFTADAELRELIERARALASHRLPKGDLSGVMKLAFASFVEREEKRRFALRSKPRQVAVGNDSCGVAMDLKSQASVAQLDSAEAETAKVQANVLRRADAPSAPLGGASHKQAKPHGAAKFFRLGTRARYISAAVRREVYVRDCGRCSFVSNDGRRCGAQAFLEFDHIRPWAALGASDIDNLRLRCRAHNGLHARNCFGARHIAGKIAASAASRQSTSPQLTCAGPRGAVRAVGDGSEAAIASVEAITTFGTRH